MNTYLYTYISLCWMCVYVHILLDKWQLINIYTLVHLPPNLSLYSGDHSLVIYIPHSFLQLHSTSLFECTKRGLNQFLDGRLGFCSYINMCSCFCDSVSISLGQIPENRLPGSKGQSACVILLDICQIHLHRIYTFLHSFQH